MFDRCPICEGKVLMRTITYSRDGVQEYIMECENECFEEKSSYDYHKIRLKHFTLEFDNNALDTLDTPREKAIEKLGLLLKDMQENGYVL